VPLTLGRRDPSAWLWVAFVLGPDPEGEHLTAYKSGFALYVDPDRDRMMLHYDYERQPAHSYPPAHVQVHGAAPDLSDLSERGSGQRKDLKDFHFPVGGRRYRPSIEDIVESSSPKTWPTPDRDGETPSWSPAAGGKTVTARCGETQPRPRPRSASTRQDHPLAGLTGRPRSREPGRPASGPGSAVDAAHGERAERSYTEGCLESAR